MDEQNSQAEQKYTEIQYARYVDKTIYNKICDIQTVIDFIHNGKFFAAESRLVGVRDGLSFLRAQTEKRLKSLDTDISKDSKI